MKYLLYLALSCALLSSCTTRDQYSAKQFRNIDEISQSIINDNLPPMLGANAIHSIASTAANKLDTQHQISASFTAQQIAANPQQCLPVMVKDADSGWSWTGWAKLGGMALLGATVLARVFTPELAPLVSGLAAKLDPDIQDTKTAAAGTICALDSILASLPADQSAAIKAKLQAKLTDLGVQPQVSNLLAALKQEVSTSNGSLNVTADELAKFLGNG